MAEAPREHWALDPDVTFLNHGSFGAALRVVLDAQHELRAQMERQPVRFFVRDLPPALAAARRAAAGFVGCGDESFTFVPNTTTGVNVALRSVSLRPEDEIVITSHEYAACRNAAADVARRSGATLRVATFDLPIADPAEVVAAIESQLDENTRIVLIDHVTSQSALVMPLEAIVASVRANTDARIIVDGAHAPGMLDLCVEELGVDFYAGNFHKWVCTPKGSAFLWCRPELLATLEPPLVSHGAGMSFDDEVDRFHFRFAWQGTSDPTPYLCVPVAIDAIGRISGSWDEARERNHTLALHGRTLLEEALGVDSLCPASMIGSIAAVKLPDSHGPAPTSLFDVDPIQDRLLDDHGIEVPIFPFPRPPHRLLRISAQLYNASRDYERLASILPDLL